MSTIPTLSEELHRKSIEAMIWLTEQYESGQITEAEFYVGRQVAFQIINGLVPSDVSSLTYSEEPEGFRHRQDVRVLKKDRSFAVLRHQVGSLVVAITSGFNPQETARLVKQPIHEVEQRLISKGWKPT